jgi:hypothetical protein
LGEDIYDVELFKKGLNNMMAGGGFQSWFHCCQRIPNNKGLKLSNSIYSDIMGGSAARAS